MIDINKQINFWRESAKEDWEVGRQLVDIGKTRHGLFFVHLALEKALKALVCRNIRDLAPRVHNLARLSELANLNLSAAQKDTLELANAFHIEGRYPEIIEAPPTIETAQRYVSNAEEVFQWLMNQ